MHTPPPNAVPTSTRVARVLFVLGLASAAVSTSTAHAAQRPAMKASPGTSVSAQYPALIGSAPTSGAVDLDPATCGEPEAVFCDNVPINVTKGGDLSIEVSWPDTDGSSIDDIDIILYDAGKNGEYTRLDSSESAARPEQINESLPAGLVNLVVVHYAGVNTGYEVLTSMPSTTQTAAAAPAVGAAPAPSTGGGGTVSSPTPPRNRSPFGNRFAAPRAPAPDSGVDFGETAGPGAVSSLGGTPSGNAAVSTAPAPQAAARPTGDAGSDLGWFAWVLAAASPLLIGAVLVLNRRSSRSAPAAI